MQQLNLVSLAFRCAIAIPGKRFVAISPTMGDRIAMCTLPTAGGNAVGVSSTEGKIGEDIAVIACLSAIVEAGAVIAVGSPIETLADGRAVPAGSGKVVARALEPAAAAGQFINVLLIPN